jgi:O-glycosyl hydrolase
LRRRAARRETWAPQPNATWSVDFPFAGRDVSVFRSQHAQSIFGFGAAFTDTSAYNAQIFMNASVRDAFLAAFWGPSGLDYSVGRVTLNSADYSFQSFNYDNVTDDFSLASFDGRRARVRQPARRAAPARGRGARDGPAAPLRLPLEPSGMMDEDEWRHDRLPRALPQE